ncbi:rubrerythrin family protein [Candidatus Bathyarchaeota archaeon]|nr:rubrerythrin family protein [Candidatus Bathyarchaeota archaeon]
MDFKGSKTEKNLLAAFAGESQARNRYTYFASKAKKEGYEQISSIFTETAGNEKEHAELFFKHLQGGDVEIIAGYPAGVIGSTSLNLKAAAEGEKMEWGTIYPNFASIAVDEGFLDIANTFKMIAKVEAYHEKRFLKLFGNVTHKKVFKKNSEIQWKCRNCGYVHSNSEAPAECPVCKHAQAYFEVWCENY